MNLIINFIQCWNGGLLHNSLDKQNTKPPFLEGSLLKDVVSCQRDIYDRQGQQKKKHQNNILN